MTRLLLLGGHGQVGWQLRRTLPLLGELRVLDRAAGGDLAHPDALRQAVRDARPDVIVNAAAFTAVDAAEDAPDLAFAINATACEVLAEAARHSGAWLVHYSSDYVYRGDGARPWLETDPCEPLGVYGRSKLAGDQAVAGWQRHLVLRTSWVFDTWGSNFLKTILKAARERESLRVVADQWGAPTRAATMADVTTLVLHQLLHDPQAEARAGTYHLAAAGETHWHAYACLALREAAALGMELRTTPERIEAVPAAVYGAKAPRPANSRLDTTLLRSRFGVSLPDWASGVRAVVAELAKK